MVNLNIRGIMQIGKEYRVPAWAACIIANADISGLNDEELAAWDKFEQSVGAHLILGDDLGFCHTNDVDRYAGDCCQAYTLVE
jgi:hypothetical protein